MWRALFLAVGVYTVLMGAQCLAVERFTLTLREKPAVVERGLLDEKQVTPGKKITMVPPPWAPWSLMSTGAIVCLYSFTLPARLKG